MPEQNLYPRDDTRTQRSLAIVVICALSVLVYINTLHNGFVMDDRTLIAGNLRIRSLLNIGDIFLHDYRPLRTISYTFDYFFWGLNPVGYHLTNIFIHVLNSLLVYAISRRMFRNYGSAFWVACLFAVHPVHTEAVSYLSGRRDVLFTLFYLSGFKFFLAYRDQGRQRDLYAVFACYVPSLLTKEMAASFPLLLFGYDVITRFVSTNRPFSSRYIQDLVRSIKRVGKEFSWFYIFLLLSIPLTIYYYVILRHASSMVSAKGIEWWGGGILSNLLTVSYVLLHYIKKTLFPVVLVADYFSFPLIRSVLDGRVLLAWLILGLMLFFVLICIRKNKVAAFSIFLYFVTLLPVLQIVPHHDLVAEHALYLPSLGFCLLVGVFYEHLVTTDPKKIPLFLVLIVLLVSFFSIRTLERNRDWKNNVTIYRDDLHVFPKNQRVHLLLGMTYMKAFLYENALREFRQAAEGEKPFAQAVAYRGFIHYRRGEYRKAIRLEEKAIKMAETPLADFVLGCLYSSMRNQEEALSYFEKIKSGHYFLPALQQIFRIYQSQWNNEEADRVARRIILESRKLLRYLPQDENLLRNLGRCYEWLREFGPAEKAYSMFARVRTDLSAEITNREETIRSESVHFQRAENILKVNPDDRNGLLLLAEAYSKIGRYGNAYELLEPLLASGDVSAAVYSLMATLYEKKKEYHQAIQYMKEAVEQQDRNAEFHYHLGRLYGADMDFGRAIS